MLRKILQPISLAHSANPERERAFTLIELSIVLVVIGLIVGGVFAAQSLIQNARLRSFTQTIASYRSALNIFKAQYDSLPGDMSNASSYWTTAINGNGNSLIDNSESDYILPMLFYAGMIKFPANTSGNDGNSLSDVMLDPRTTNSAYYTAPINSKFHMFSYNSTNSSLGIFSPQQTYGLDIKIDDGLADHGFLGSEAGSLSSCTSGNWGTTRTYTLSGSSASLRDCRLWVFF